MYQRPIVPAVGSSIASIYPRTSHLVDMDAEIGEPNATAKETISWRRIYPDLAVGTRPGDRDVVGRRAPDAKTVWFALHDEGIQRVVSLEAGGGGRPIFNAIDIDHRSPGSERLVISGLSGTLARPALRARDLGTQVHEVVGLGISAHEPGRACSTHMSLRPDQPMLFRSP